MTKRTVLTQHAPARPVHRWARRAFLCTAAVPMLPPAAFQPRIAPFSDTIHFNSPCLGSLLAATLMPAPDPSSLPFFSAAAPTCCFAASAPDTSAWPASLASDPAIRGLLDTAPRVLGIPVLVNLPAFELEAVEQGQAVLRMPVIIGEPEWSTPVLQDEVFVVPDAAADELPADPAAKGPTLFTASATVPSRRPRWPLTGW